jgi:hypothetical protein
MEIVRGEEFEKSIGGRDRELTFCTLTKQSNTHTKSTTPKAKAKKKNHCVKN